MPRRWALPLAAILGLVQASVLGWILVGQHGAASSYLERATMNLGKSKVALVAVSVLSSAVGACRELTTNLRAEERDFLAQCPAKARKVVADFDLPPDGGDGVVLKG